MKRKKTKEKHKLVMNQLNYAILETKVRKLMRFVNHINPLVNYINGIS